jgi:hypothetical protein
VRRAVGARRLRLLIVVTPVSNDAHPGHDSDVQPAAARPERHLSIAGQHADSHCSYRGVSLEVEVVRRETPRMAYVSRAGPKN